MPNITTTLTNTLDASTEPWQLWRAASGKWYLRRGDSRNDPSSRTLEGDTLVDVLQAAVNSKRLPTIPRKPPLHHYVVEKSGTGSRTWKVMCDGRPILHLGRKGDALDHVERFQRLQIKARDAWVDEHFHFIDTHTEGVDFYWID